MRNRAQTWTEAPIHHPHGCAGSGVQMDRIEVTEHSNCGHGGCTCSDSRCHESGCTNMQKSRSMDRVEAPGHPSCPHGCASASLSVHDRVMA